MDSFFPEDYKKEEPETPIKIVYKALIGATARQEAEEQDRQDARTNEAHDALKGR